MSKIPFQKIDWSAIEKTKHIGETGTSFWQTMQFPGLRIRLVEYSEGYLADYWCQKGHIVHCLEGEFVSEQELGRLVGVQKAQISKLENSLTDARVETILKVFKALNAKISFSVEMNR